MSQHSNNPLINENSQPFTLKKRKRHFFKKRISNSEKRKKNQKATTTSEMIQTQEEESENIKEDLVLITNSNSIDILNPQTGTIQTEMEEESVRIGSVNDTQNKIKKNEDIISTCLEIFKSEDIEEISEIMNELSEKLSIAHESIAENPNCTQLIKELIKLLEKYQIPELSSKISFNFTFYF
jgi:hypothetical protein